MYFGQTPFVTELVKMMVLLPQQDEAVGQPEYQLLPHCTVRLLGQLTVRPDAQLVTSARNAVGEKPGSPLELLFVR